MLLAQLFGLGERRSAVCVVCFGLTGERQTGRSLMYGTVGTAYSTVGTVYSTVGTVYSTVGTVYSTIGTVYSTVGTVYITVGTVYTTVGTVYSGTYCNTSNSSAFYSTV